MDDNGTIDLKKLRKNLPPPPVEVAPLGAGLPPRPLPTPPPPPPQPKAYIPIVPNTALYAMRRKSGLSAFIAKIPLPGRRHLIIGVVAVAVLFGAYYIYVNFWTKSPFGPTAGDAKAESASVTTTSPDMTEEQIIAAVGKIMLLPTDETPTLAKVSDLSALQSQEFFKNAAVGDVVLMYPKSLRAILFDPTQDKIIEVGPITATGSTTAATSTSAHS